MTTVPLHRRDLNFSDETNKLENKFSEKNRANALAGIPANPCPSVMLGCFEKKSKKYSPYLKG